MKALRWRERKDPFEVIARREAELLRRKLEQRNVRLIHTNQQQNSRGRPR